jgi:sulfoxide reductase heme-binding subunit YedZ
MIRRLGKAWPRLHKTVYVIAILGLIHYYLQAKIDVSDPVFWTGAFLLLMGHRAMQRFGWPTNPLTLAGLAVAAALLSALLEAAWYGVASGIPASLVLSANLDVPDTIRPAWWVLALGLAVPVLNAVRARMDKSGRGKAKVAPASRPSPAPAPAREVVAAR